MPDFNWATIAVYAADLLIRIGFSVRIIKRRLPVGVALAWLFIVLVFPFAGACIYLLIGESRLGRKRRQRAEALRPGYRDWSTWQSPGEAVEPHALSPCAHGVARLGETVLESPLLPGNAIQLLHDAGEAFPVLIREIDAAKHTCHIEFYIWDVGGKADEVVEAVLRAAGRGVSCRLLLDAVGSKRFLRSDRVRRLRAAGVKVWAALPVNLRRLLFVRADLRLHRKIVVIDESVAFTGSLNLADPALFKQNAGVGQWVDALARIQGSSVAALSAIFLYDWELETGEVIARPSDSAVRPAVPSSGPAAVQVLPSGPGEQRWR